MMQFIKRKETVAEEKLSTGAYIKTKHNHSLKNKSQLTTLIKTVSTHKGRQQTQLTLRQLNKSTPALKIKNNLSG